jgi:hypothetical protein
VGQDRVEALVGVVPESIDVVGEPGESSWERGREDVDLARGVDYRAHRGRQFVDVGDSGVGDEQEPLDRRRVVRWRRVGCCAVWAAHDVLLSSGCLAMLGRRARVGRMSASSLTWSSAISTVLPSCC